MLVFWSKAMPFKSRADVLSRLDGNSTKVVRSLDGAAARTQEYLLWPDRLGW